MIQDIFPYKMDNGYRPDAVPKASDYVLCLEGNLILLSKESMEFPKVSDMKALEPKEAEPYRYLFSVGEERYFLWISDLKELPEGFWFVSIRDVRGEDKIPKYRQFAAMTGKHLADWYRDSQFCGRCGNKMQHSPKERAMCCNVCDYTAYPRIMPAVIVGVVNGSKLLLTRYRTGFAHNALVAGFTEIGETLEETVHREVMEETGLKVKNIRYYKSQPWGLANDILMGFFCDVDGDDTIKMDEEELKMACFTEREDIVLQPDDASLTGEMMKVFKENRNERKRTE